MAYRYGDRHQRTLLPPCVEDYVPENAPVRAYDAFVDALDFEKLGIKIDPNKVGNPEYNPPSMLKLLVYGYSYGVRSSRKLEREVNYNLSFIWLVGGLKPDFKTINEFRRNNKSALKDVLKQCARMCVKLNLIAGNTLFVDGTKIRANASSDNNWTKKRCDEALEKVDKRIRKILEECDKADEQESGHPSMVHMNEELKNSEILKQKVLEIARELEDSGRNRTNTTDPESRLVKSHGEFLTGYNAQIGTDGQHGLITAADVIQNESDRNTLSDRYEDANDNIDDKYETVVADNGYMSTADLKKIGERGATVVVPTQDQAGEREQAKHMRDDFRYDAKHDCYYCPENRRLGFIQISHHGKYRMYVIEKSEYCHSCARYGECTESRRGRTYRRLVNQEYYEKFQRQYIENKDLYEQRKAKAEHPFGHIKWNLGMRNFLLRGLEGARAEFSLAATAFNMRRMMSILGIKGLTTALAGL